MEKKRFFYWGVQVAGWTAYFMFSILLLLASNNFVSTINVYLFAGLSIIAAILISHGIRYIIIKRSLLKQPIVKLVFITLGLSVLAAFTLEYLQFLFEILINIDFVVGEETGTEFNWPSFLFGVSRSIILFSLWCGFYYVFAIVEKSREQEILNLKWEASKNEIELKNLRAQLNPHFLFNSLNSIRALVALDPEQSKTSITQLSNLLRKSINLGKLRVIPLKEELELVRIYLDLESVRFEERLRTAINIDDNALSCEIPPLMIQTIVENGIKHGISQSIEGGLIQISASHINDILCIEIKNTGKLESDFREKGIGIANTKKRLALLYGKNADFKIEQVGDEVVVVIKIKYK